MGVAFVLLLPFYGRLEDDGHLWWLWTCVAGFGLGLVGWDHSRGAASAARAQGLTETCQWSLDTGVIERGLYYTATTLDGFIADEHDSLAWLFVQDIDQEALGGYNGFITGVGAMVMGSTTYMWLRDHLQQTGEAWSYDIPCWVFTHRELEVLGEDIRFVSGAVEDHHAEIAESAGDRDIWVVGGGDLAGQFADLVGSTR